MSNLKVLDLTKAEDAKDFELLEPGKRFFFKGQEWDIRKITLAQAEQLAADKDCKFLAKKGVNKWAEPKAEAAAPEAPGKTGKADKSA